MKNVLIINGVEPYPQAPGQLNATYVELAKKYFEENGCIVNVTKVCEEYSIEEEIKKFLAADLVILQMPMEWFNVSWSCKKYLDYVLTTGSQGVLCNGDGRHKENPKEGYGTGGNLTGKYMLSVTSNAPRECFGNAGERLMRGLSEDDVLVPLHLTFQYIGLKPVKSFFSADVYKNPTIEEDIERFKEHLKHQFPF